MGKPACVKGMGLEPARNEVRRILGEGLVPRADLVARLRPEELLLLDDEIVPAIWYPISAHVRFLEILLVYEGHGDVEYLIEHGRQGAKRALSGGPYSQIFEQAARLPRRRAHDLMLYPKMLFNFSRWKIVEHPGDAFCLEISQAAEFDPLLCYTVAGASEIFGVHFRGEGVRVQWERPEPDRILFHARKADA